SDLDLFLHSTPPSAPRQLHSFPTRRSSDLSRGFNLHTRRGIPQRRLERYAEVLQDSHLARISSPDLYWDQIAAIEPGDCLVAPRSEEHTSELQSLAYIVCRLLLEKKKNVML